MANLPMEFTLSGKRLSVKRLNIKELAGEFQRDAYNAYLDDVNNMAKRITDKRERQEYIDRSTKNTPKGSELEDAGRKLMDGLAGGTKILLIALNKCQKVELEDVEKYLADVENSSVIPLIINYAVGLDVEEVVKDDKPAPANAIVIDTEKKTSE